MQFLADECCDFAVVRALREEGHHVLAVSEFQQSSVDRELLQLALNSDRILLTEDKDFGWLVFAGRADSPGVVLIRYPSFSRGSLGPDIVALVRNHSARLVGAFAVVRPGSVRISPKLS